MDRHRRHVSTTKSMAENSSMLFTSHFLTQELVHAEEKHCSFFLTASSRGTRGGRRLQQRWQKNDDDDGNGGDGRGRGEKKTVVGGGSCTRTRNVTCSVCAGGPCIEALAARCCRIVEEAGDGDGGAVWRRRGGRGADAGAAQLLQLHLLGGILLMASMVAGTMGSTSILGR